MKNLLKYSLVVASVTSGTKATAQEADQPVVTFDERPTSVLIEEATEILASFDKMVYSKAIENLNSIILTKPVSEAKRAHELLGYAYQKMGQYDKAMREYQLYLSLYPEEDEDRERVKQRLMAIEILEPQNVKIGDIVQRDEPNVGSSTTFTGAISEYANVNISGKARVDLITGVQATYIKVSNQYKFTSRVRYTDFRTLGKSKSGRQTLYNAYVEFEDTYKHYDIRLGRQNPSAGALTRYDGVYARYDPSRTLRIEISAGIPAVNTKDGIKRRFMGTELTLYGSKWATSLYYNRSTADGFIERSAVGTTVNYNTDKTNILVRAEYDTKFKLLNTISSQVTVKSRFADFFLSYERRKTPIPYIDSVFTYDILTRNTKVSLADIFNNVDIPRDTVYKVIGSTPYMNTLVVGGTKVINSKWRLTADVAITNVSNVNPIRVTQDYVLPVQIGQKKLVSYTLHATGENVIKNTTVDIVASKTFGPVHSQYATASTTTRFGKDNRNSFSAIVRYDTSFSLQPRTTKATTFSGLVRSVFRLSNRTSLELQASTSRTRQAGETRTEKGGYLGIRYDW